ncbi:MAG: pyruvate kinase [Planctomycetota bacterium]|jgi:pyruvate kinase
MPTAASIPFDQESASLIHELYALRMRTREVESAYADRMQRICESRQPSARNLIHYVSLRQQDLRSLQQELICRGLSSLGRCEANVHASLNTVIGVLCELSEREQPKIPPAEVDFVHSRELLDQSTDNLFGPRPSGRAAHIMVTMPSEAAQDRTLVSDLVAHGMGCMRVNCAHDDPAAWRQMIGNLRQACEEQDHECKVAMDLGGPKLRTGPIESGVAVLKWRPRRDALGRAIAPARIWLHNERAESEPPLPADATVPVLDDWLAQVKPGDEISFKDARGRTRTIHVTEQTPDGAWAESTQTSYLTPGTHLMLQPRASDSPSEPGRVGEITPAEKFLVLHRGERLLLGDDHKIGTPARYDEHGQLVRSATIGCTLPSVFRDLKRGERVLFDDGKITTVVDEVHPHHVVLEVTEAGKNGTKLRADKGINLPDTDLHLDALTEKDIEDLAFVVEHADIVSYSFVRREEDVERLQSELARLGRPDMPIILKIENRQAFERLPSLLLTVMRSPASGVMIARGDLAVELGWQRLAEVQEEILWMCEAAHMPVVWATQVLESLAKTGMPSRAEITDAAMGVRAESVMLNKGPHILEAVHVLSGILHRMQDHQIKKRPMLRRLKLADDLTVPTTGPH